MLSTTRPSSSGNESPRSDIHIVSLDIGSSSVRTLLFDGEARQVHGFGAQLAYRVTTTADGGVEADADELVALAVQALSVLHGQMAEAGLRATAVSFCTFWHSFLGVGADGKPVTAIIHLFDTRSASQVKRLAEMVDVTKTHPRTGTVLHASYWPAKLMWLKATYPEAVAKAKFWMSPGEYLFLKLFGKAVNSTSMASGTGIWDQNRNEYDEEFIEILPVSEEQLAAPGEMDEPQTALLADFARQWPGFNGIPWFPAFGDGACNNIGSGCTTPDRFALMVGTSGAMRAVLEQESIEIPPGLWCYRVDRKRFVLGGALSNGGEVFAWMKRTLQLPGDDELEAALGAMTPGAHGLTIVPLFAGERSTKWRSDARAAFAGMSMHTGPVDLVRAALESVALRFRLIYLILRDRVGDPAEVVASGGALLRSPVWTQMMADALGRPIVTSCEAEASSRGAALLVLERIGAISHIRELPA
ncbi:MAG: gluconokinase, partial [Bryobacteraceae bacterium]